MGGVGTSPSASGCSSGPASLSGTAMRQEKKGRKEEDDHSLALNVFNSEISNNKDIVKQGGSKIKTTTNKIPSSLSLSDAIVTHLGQGCAL